MLKKFKLTAGYIVFIFSLFQNLQAQNISRIEYFFDSDPGFGNGTAVSFTPASNINDLLFNIDISGLGNGVHNLFIRSWDGTNWSITSKVIFAKGIINPGNISALEYFIGTDPGFGNGTPVSFSPGSDVSNINFTVNTSALPNGTHYLFVRSRELTGNWSITAAVQFTKGNILPVSLLDFRATPFNATVKLAWETATESDNDRFVIERSFDGRVFDSIGEVPGSGNSNTIQYYQSTDFQPNLNGNNWYRLKQVDYDNKYHYSPVRLVRFINGTNDEITIYPTVTSNTINIYNSTTTCTFSLFDESGRLLFKRIAGNSNIILDLSNYRNGVYLLVADKKGQILKTQKIIKQ